MDDLEKQIDYFEKHREKLLEEHDGKYALVYDGQIDVYSTVGEAIGNGFKKYGDKDFLVRGISDLDEHVSIPALDAGVLSYDPRI